MYELARHSMYELIHQCMEKQQKLFSQTFRSARFLSVVREYLVRCNHLRIFVREGSVVFMVEIVINQAQQHGSSSLPANPTKAWKETTVRVKDRAPYRV